MSPETGALDNLTRRGLISPEYRVLLLCARARLGNAERAELIELLARPLRWDYLLNHAERHGLAPLLWRHTEQISGLPDAVTTHLATYFANNTRRNLALASTLFSILDVLSAAGITAVPYKGPALSDSLYGHLGYRECADVDVLVPAKDAIRAKRGLQSAGFAEVFPATDAQDASRVRAGEAFEFIAENGTLVELQWQALPRAWSADIGESHWTRLQPRQFAGRTVQTFAPEDLLLTLALHGAKHAWQRLIWIADIHEILQSSAGLQPGNVPTLDLHELLSRANASGTRRCVLLAVKLAHMLLGTTVPDALTVSISKDPKLDSLAERAIRMAVQREASISAISAHGYFLRTRERAIDRARFCYRFLTTPGYHEWSLVSLPAPLFPLYSVLRMLRVAGKMVWNPYSSPLSGAGE